MHIGIPQFILLLLWAASFGLVAAKHGQPKNENYNVFVTILALAIEFSLLYCGGFFR